jgi:hypothetical protein
LEISPLTSETVTNSHDILGCGVYMGIH